MLVRRGVPMDLIPMLNIGRIMHAESGFASIPFDERAAAETIATFINDPPNPWRVALLAESKGEIQGGILCFTTPYYFSRTRYVSELALYLLPQSRGGLVALRLIRSMLAWGRDQGALQARVGVTAGINNHVASGLYARLGFEPHGTVFVKNL